jgi:hypothetical protein
MNDTPADLTDIEQDILHAARDAASGITQRLTELWPAEYAAGDRQHPTLFDAFEHVVQFETACILRKRLQQKDGSWQYVSWEHRYSDTYGGRLDLVVSRTKEQADLSDRLAIEVKWMSEVPDGLAGAASDALKLMWATASGRYLLLFGRHSQDTLIVQLRAATQDDGQMSDWKASELDQARRLLAHGDKQLLLAGYEPLRDHGDVAIALVRVPYGKTLP